MGMTTTCTHASTSGDTVVELMDGALTVTRFFCDDCAAFTDERVEHWNYAHGMDWFTRYSDGTVPAVKLVAFEDGDNADRFAHL
jgi:hypothetical protein